MAMVPCDICGKAGHPWFDCPRRGDVPANWKPPRLAGKPAPAAEPPKPKAPDAKTIETARKALDKADAKQRAKALAKPDDITDVVKKAGRPRLHPDRKAYKAAKQREYRAKQREPK